MRHTTEGGVARRGCVISVPVKGAGPRAIAPARGNNLRSAAPRFLDSLMRALLLFTQLSEAVLEAGGIILGSGDAVSGAARRQYHSAALAPVHQAPLSK